MNFKRLDEVANNASRRFSFENIEEAVFINTGDVLGGKFLHNELSLVDELPGQAKKAIKKDDILYSEIRPGNKRYAFIEFKPQNYVVSTKFMVIESSGEVLPKYLYIYLTNRNIETKLKQIADSRSGTFPQVTFDSIGHLKVYVPGKDAQRNIIDVWESIDQKIQLNQQTNQILEAIAQAIFKSWFVDFDPLRAKIRAKQEGHDPERAAMAAIAGVPLHQNWEEIEAALEQKLSNMTEARREELKHTASLFPDALVDSELGEVPKGWEIRTFFDTIEIIGGGTPKTKIDEYWNGDILWYSVVDAPSNGDVFVINTERKITEKGLSNSSTKLVDVGTTIISARGTVGKVALTPKLMAYNQSCYGLKSKSECAYFNYYKTKQLVESLQRGSHGSVFDTITQKTFKSIEVAQPSRKLEMKFDQTVKNMMAKILNNLVENASLKRIRDTLLPKLISGEIEMERVVQNA